MNSFKEGDTVIYWRPHGGEHNGKKATIIHGADRLWWLQFSDGTRYWAGWFNVYAPKDYYILRFKRLYAKV